MAITLDTIVNKSFKTVKNGYDNNEVEAFLDEILEEMENREAETAKLKEQVASLSRELDQARVQASVRPAAAPAPVKAQDHSSESFELVLTKARNVYDEIVATAETRADEIVGKANVEAANIRENAQSQITDLTEKLTALRKQASDYYTSMKRVMDNHAAAMDQMKKLL